MMDGRKFSWSSQIFLWLAASGSPTSSLPTVLRPDRLSSKVVLPLPDGLHRTMRAAGEGRFGWEAVSGGHLHHGQQPWPYPAAARPYLQATVGAPCRLRTP